MEESVVRQWISFCDSEGMFEAEDRMHKAFDRIRLNQRQARDLFMWTYGTRQPLVKDLCFEFNAASAMVVDGVRI